MAGQELDEDFGRESKALRSELGAWQPSRGPDLRDLLLRADRHGWRRPLFVASLTGTGALALLLAVALALVGLNSLFPGTESLREHLLAP